MPLIQGNGRVPGWGYHCYICAEEVYHGGLIVILSATAHVSHVPYTLSHDSSALPAADKHYPPTS